MTRNSTSRISPNHPAGRKLAAVRGGAYRPATPSWDRHQTALFDRPMAGAESAARPDRERGSTCSADAELELVGSGPSDEAAVTAALSRRLGPPVATPRGLIQADAELAAALNTDDPAEQFRHAHLSAIRSAAAIVEFRGRPHPRMHARTVWEMLTIVEPEFAPWATYFASGAALRAMAESGLGDQIDAMRVAEVTACAEDFRAEVANWFDALFAASDAVPVDDSDAAPVDNIEATRRPHLRLLQPVAA